MIALRRVGGRGPLAAALMLLPVTATGAAHATVWSLTPTPRASPGWSAPLPKRSTDAVPAMLPDPTSAASTGPEPSPPQDFSIAPSVDNILNSRHDLSEDPLGEPGSSSGYLRSVGRTFGLALKKSLY